MWASLLAQNVRAKPDVRHGRCNQRSLSNGLYNRLMPRRNASPDGAWPDRTS
jgi:hypothetical protein